MLNSIVNLGKTGPGGKAQLFLLGYDDLYSIQYMRRNLRPYWRRNGWDAADLLRAAFNDLDQSRCHMPKIVLRP